MARRILTVDVPDEAAEEVDARLIGTCRWIVSERGPLNGVKGPVQVRLTAPSHPTPDSKFDVRWDSATKTEQVVQHGPQTDEDQAGEISPPYVGFGV